MPRKAMMTKAKSKDGNGVNFGDLKSASEEELSALMQSILDKAFKGEL